MQSHCQGNVTAPKSAATKWRRVGQRAIFWSMRQKVFLKQNIAILCLKKAFCLMNHNIAQRVGQPRVLASLLPICRARQVTETMMMGGARAMYSYMKMHFELQRTQSLHAKNASLSRCSSQSRILHPKAIVPEKIRLDRIIYQKIRDRAKVLVEGFISWYDRPISLFRTPRNDQCLLREGKGL